MTTIDEPDRLEAQARLDTLQVEGGWLQVASSIHRDGREAPFWLLIRDASDMMRALPVFMGVIEPYLGRFPDTEFTVSFRSKDGAKATVWDCVEDHELRAGRVSRVLGLDAATHALDEYDVFGRNF